MGRALPAFFMKGVGKVMRFRFNNSFLLIKIPVTRLSAGIFDDNVKVRALRRELRDKLMSGERIVISYENLTAVEVQNMPRSDFHEASPKNEDAAAKRAHLRREVLKEHASGISLKSQMLSVEDVPLVVLKTHLSSDNDAEAAAALRRLELRDRLVRGETISVRPSGEAVTNKDTRGINEPTLTVPLKVPETSLSSGNDAEAAAALRRRELRDKLVRGETISVRPSGEAVTNKDARGINEPTLTVPESKLAETFLPNYLEEEYRLDIPSTKLCASFYWYENDTDLLDAEIDLMFKQFPQFELRRLEDGRLCWTGNISQKNIGGSEYEIEMVYDHNHPHKQSWGGSITVYIKRPDLNAMAEEIGHIPHTLRDAKGRLYICTADPKDLKASKTSSTSAASVVGLASKWLIAFELWLGGDLSTSTFGAHNGL